MIKQVAVSDFVKRQIVGSGKTFAVGLSFESIAKHAEIQLRKGHFRNGYRDGVILVKVDTTLIHHFVCPFIKITENTKLKAVVTKRRPNEEPYIQIRAINGTPLKTGSAELILYRHDVLAETNEQSSNSEWEVISFHAIPEGLEKMPMGPTTMMRNQLQLEGGTKAKYSSDEWAESVKFWQEYAVLSNV
ncbi:MAG: DUF3228 family protein [Candidatus Marinimicrobia bacterium]|nr:DUF3228 family protein [Candidatus Neomarinimicrobiota bacterium]MBL7022725.1 DUF3228 family protein [Candidatus Neomarinimicrobiota bacterium]MBL7109146.1 DUF3228 family protein [Candidatus Neomarinimicrobiota bacterium]